MRLQRHRRVGHTHTQINRQRRTALLMVITGSIRTVGWLGLTVAYLLHLSVAVRLFASVSFVAVLSSLALAETAWSQVAGSLAQLTAGDVHSEVAHARQAAAIDTAAIERDLERLAALQPGAEGNELAAQIRAQIHPLSVGESPATHTGGP